MKIELPPYNVVENSNGSLSHLLSATKDLNETLPLRKLVSVNRSILRVAAPVGNVVEAGATEDPCSQSSSSYLLTVQWLAQRIVVPDGENGGLAALALLVLPCPPSDELVVDAIVDALVDEPSSSNGGAMWLAYCVGELMKVLPNASPVLSSSLPEELVRYLPAKQSMTWKTSCQLLGRLAKAFAASPVMENAIIDRILQGITCGRETAAVLTPLVHFILPAAVQHVGSIPAPVWSALRENSSHLLTATTILCSLSPHQQMENVPSQEEDWLWDLVYNCIAAPSDPSQKEYGVLLRRRGLFLLDTICSFASREEGQPAAAAWKRYVTCFETLVMETCTHLHEQVWTMLVALLDELPWRWMEPLVRCVVLENEFPHTRKLALHRLLGRTSNRQMAVDFWSTAIVPGVDSLVGVVGMRFTTLQNSDTGLLEQMTQAVCDFLCANPLAETWDPLIKAFWGLQLREKTSAALHTAIRMAWEKVRETNSQRVAVTVDEDFLQSVLAAWKRCGFVFSRVYQRYVLESLAITLAHAAPCKPDKKNVPPPTILETVAMYAEHSNVGREHLQTWLRTHHSRLASAVPTAFVDAFIIPDSDVDVKHGYTTETERRVAAAVVSSCVLVAGDAASGLLWPAVHKGLAQATSNNKQARAQLLLHYGCEQKVLSGIGNGGLVVTANREVMMPPPPGIEDLLFRSFRFLEQAILGVLDDGSSSKNKTRMRSSRSDDVRSRTQTFNRLVDQLRVLVESFPSSESNCSALKEMEEKCLSMEGIEHGALLYASLVCGSKLPSASKAITSLLNMNMPRRVSRSARSIFQVIKWGSLSFLLEQAENTDWVYVLHDAALDAIESVPSDAVVLVFECMKGTAKILTKEQYDEQTDKLLTKFIGAFFGLLNEAEKSTDVLLMVDGFCLFLFQHHLLVGEAKRSKMPIRSAFRKLVEMAGSNRSYISRTVLSRLCASWLSGGCEVFQSIALYRDDLLSLLSKKEVKMSPSEKSKAESSDERCAIGGIEDLGNDTSVSRFIILVMISRLPALESLPVEFVENVLNFLVKNLLAVVKAPPKDGGTIVFGALCVLVRFVSEDTARHIAKHIFQGIGKQNPHSQARYFVEVLVIQGSRRHPRVFSQLLVDQLQRTDLSAHEVASVMVIVGNLFVGRYADDCLSSKVFTQSEVQELREGVLAGVVRWLSSTQSFARAIAQLLAFKLIPTVVDVGSPRNSKLSDKQSAWYLLSVYKYLLENSDAKRLREKQQQFFDVFDVEEPCTPVGLSRLPVDMSGEVNPGTMVECIADCLKDMMEEAEDKFMDLAVSSPEPAEKSEGNSVVEGNLQRKIVPVDALNLALETAREQRLRNFAGRRKQELIVCATLIDKAPNLGGLCRTAEIFAAKGLVVPDKNVVKNEVFTALSVGATDWIDIEECKEKDLLGWLRIRREEGYHIVGLEQTSSSMSLERYPFPNKPTVLLLGKEREGIPVKYLQIVDQCLEIPQLGIIRSLNVHVSGAICIWEFSRQRMKMEQDSFVQRDGKY